MKADAAPRSVVFSADGHSAITGRHAKTVEVTAESAITSRATCVIGTGARIPVAALQAVRGRAVVELSSGDVIDRIEGEVNPHYVGPDRWVVRRSALLAPDTFLVNASRAVADLDPALVRALAQESATLRVAVRELAEPDPVALIVVCRTHSAVAPELGLPPGLVRLAEQVDEVINKAGVGARWPSFLPRRATGSAVRRPPRTIAVLTRDLGQVADLHRLMPQAGPRLRTVIWPPASPGAELLASAGGPVEPVLHAGTIPGRATARRDYARRIAHSGLVAAAGTSPDDPRALQDLIDLLPEHSVLLPDPSVGWGVLAARLDPGHSAGADLAGLARHPVVVFVPPRRDDPPLPVQPDLLVRLLQDAGLSGRSIREVVAALGGDRRSIYTGNPKDRGPGARRAPGLGVNEDQLP